jgi:hypothetical protein
MKLTGHFTDFLNDIVNLNPTRLTRLENSVSAIKDVIRGSGWTPRSRGFVEQGSWAHKTIIKPLESKAFDADLLALVDPVVGWEAKDYVNGLYDVFSNHATYKDKARRWDYCVTITYADDFKIDITPCIKQEHIRRRYLGARRGARRHGRSYPSNEQGQGARQPQGRMTWARRCAAGL